MKVVIGTVHGETVSGWYCHSLLQLHSHIRKHPEQFDIDDQLMVRSGPALAGARGRLIGSFLKDCPDAEALLVLDSDMVFSSDTIWAMIDAFDRMRQSYDNVGLLGGLAFMTDHLRGQRPIPTIWLPYPGHPHGMVQPVEYEKNALIEVAATGGACVIMAREALEAVTKECPNPFHHINLVNWNALAAHLQTLDDVDEIEKTMRDAVMNSDQLGEDISLCVRLHDVGYRSFVHTGLKFDHAKTSLIGEPEFCDRPLDPKLAVSLEELT